MLSAEEHNATVWPRRLMRLHDCSHGRKDARAAIRSTNSRSPIPSRSAKGFAMQIASTSHDESLELHAAEPISHHGFGDTQNPRRFWPAGAGSDHPHAAVAVKPATSVPSRSKNAPTSGPGELAGDLPRPCATADCGSWVRTS